MPALDDIEARVKGGERPSVSVRELLRWFGAERRGSNVVYRIRRALRNRDLKTVPDFDEVWIDSEVTIGVLESPYLRGSPERDDENSDLPPPPRPSEPGIPPAPRLRDGVYRIGMLDSANRGVEYIPPGTALKSAVTIMMTRGYSQLPVMNSGMRSCKGAVTWKSVAEPLALGRQPMRVDECLVLVKTLDSETSLIDAIPDIITTGFVLVSVRADENVIKGIITMADLGNQLRSLTEPFLLLGQIENNLRALIDSSFTADELRQLKHVPDPAHPVESASDLSFGEYVRLLEHPERWKKPGLKPLHALDRPAFVQSLKDVNEVRNDVMHFSNDPVSAKQLASLRAFARCVEKVLPR